MGRYVLASLALGLITIWGSENLFWTAPPADLTVAEWLMTWAAYAICSAAALSAVALTGLGGWRGVFLGGVVFGYAIEGVIVDTVYDAFPFQLVWTAMAWHALFTALGLVWLWRWAVGRSWATLVGVLLGISLFGTIFGTFWATERQDLPTGDIVLFYLAGVGFVVPLGHLILDRLHTVPRPPRWVLLICPALLTLLWLAKTATAFAPQRLALPVVVGLTLWAMSRLGERNPVALGGTGQPRWRHLFFPLAPALTALCVVPIWESGALFQGNWITLLLTGPLSVGLWLWLLVAAARRPAR